MISTAAKVNLKNVTPEEYLKMDRVGIREKVGKNELFNQKLLLLNGGTVSHGELIVNLATVLNMQKMQKQTVHRIITDTKVTSFLEYKNYFYPDVFVVENEVIFDDEQKDVVTNPILIVEVLSQDSTEAFDRGDKFEVYRQIPTFKEYILVSQNKRRIEQFYKNTEGEWIYKSFETGDIDLKNLPFSLNMDWIYQGISFNTPSVLEE